MFLPAPAVSAVIRFPDQELASEYVFPIFKDPKVVLNRNVTLSNRFEICLSGALRTDEPFYSPYSLSASMAFYWNESHGMGLSGLFFVPGLSNTGLALKNKGVANNKEQVNFYLDMNLAPRPLLGAFLNYQFSPLYGKISITKTFNLNFALYSFLGFGVMGLNHGNKEPLIITPASHFGIGQRFYINRYFALSVGMDFLIYRGPNPISNIVKWRADEAAPPRPAYNEFEKDIFFRFLARMGLTVLL